MEAVATTTPLSGRLLGALVADLRLLVSVPREFFEDPAHKVEWMIPLLMALLFSAATLTVYSLRVPSATKLQEMSEKSAQVGHTLTQEEREEILQSSGSGLNILKSLSVLLIGYVALGLLVASYFFLLFGVLGGKTTFRRVFAVYQWSFVPPVVVGSILQFVLMAVIDRGSLPADLELLLPANLTTILGIRNSPVLRSIGSSMDVFSFWALYLLSHGLCAAVGKLGPFKVRAGLAGSWLVYVALKTVISLGF